MSSGHRRHRQAMRGAGAQRVTGRQIVGKARIGAAGNDEPDTGRGTARKQRSDAGPSPGRGRPGLVLIEPVHHDDKPTCPLFRLGCRRCQKVQPYARPRPGHGWRSPTGRIEGIELLDHGIEERVAVGLARETAGDEERHDVHASRRMGDEPRRQGALTRPRASLPPCVRVGASAELGPVRQLTLAADERVGGDVADLRQVGRSHQLALLSGDDIRQPAHGRGQPEQFRQPAEIRRR